MGIIDPSDIAGLYISLRSDTGLNDTAGEVDSWEDQSSNGYDLAPTATSSSITVAQNGGPNSNIPVLTVGAPLFNASAPLPTVNDPIDFTLVFAIYTPATVLDMWRAFDGVSSSANNPLLTGFGSPPTHNLVAKRVGAGSDWITSSAQGTGWTDDTWTIITVVFDGTNTDGYIYADGTQIGVDTTNYNGTAEVWSGFALVGVEIAGVWAYDSALSAGDQADIEAYASDYMNGLLSVFPEDESIIFNIR